MSSDGMVEAGLLLMWTNYRAAAWHHLLATKGQYTDTEVQKAKQYHRTVIAGPNNPRLPSRIEELPAFLSEFIRLFSRTFEVVEASTDPDPKQIHTAFARATCLYAVVLLSLPDQFPFVVNEQDYIRMIETAIGPVASFSRIDPDNTATHVVSAHSPNTQYKVKN